MRERLPLHQCGEDEFKAFLSAYPRKLTPHSFMNRTTYHDWCLGDLERSVVANEGWGYYDTPIDYFIADIRDVRKLYLINKVITLFKKIFRK